MSQTRPNTGQSFGQYLDAQIEAGFKSVILPRTGVRTAIKIGEFYFKLSEELQAEKADLDIEGIRSATMNPNEFSPNKFWLNVSDDEDNDLLSSK